jgi:hypothetical protein
MLAVGNTVKFVFECSKLIATIAISWAVIWSLTYGPAFLRAVEILILVGLLVVAIRKVGRPIGAWYD